MVGSPLITVSGLACMVTVGAETGVGVGLGIGVGIVVGTGVTTGLGEGVIVGVGLVQESESALVSALHSGLDSVSGFPQRLHGHRQRS